MYQACKAGFASRIQNSKKCIILTRDVSLKLVTASALYFEAVSISTILECTFVLNVKCMRSIYLFLSLSKCHHHCRKMTQLVVNVETPWQYIQNESCIVSRIVCEMHGIGKSDNDKIGKQYFLGKLKSKSWRSHKSESKAPHMCYVRRSERKIYSSGFKQRTFISYTAFE